MQFDGKTIKANKAELSAFLEFASDDECRPSLNGIAVDQDRRMVFATDGYRLLCWAPDVNAKRGSAKRPVIPAEFVQTVLRAMKKNDVASLTLKAGRVDAECPRGFKVSTLLPRNADAPEASKVFVAAKRTTKGLGVLTVNPKFLDGLTKVAVMLEPHMPQVRIHTSADKLGPIRVVFPLGKCWHALIMPMLEQDAA